MTDSKLNRLKFSLDKIMNLFINIQNERTGLKPESDFRISLSLKNFILMLGGLIFLTQCATKPQILPDEREILRERVREFWQYQIDGKVEKAYQAEIPEFRDQVSIVQYLNRFKLIKYVEADILEVDLRGNEASSSVKVTYIMLLKKFTDKKLTKTEKENWVKLQNIWYHVPGDFEIKKR
jgi:hypothetical protein